MELPVKKLFFTPIEQRKSTGQVEIDWFAYTYMPYICCILAVSKTTVRGAFPSPAARDDRSGTRCQYEHDSECICKTLDKMGDILPLH